MSEVRELGRQGPAEIGALLDVGDLVGSVLHTLAALRSGDALQPAGEERDA